MLRPGEHAPVPATTDDLLIEALRTVERMSGLLNDINAKVMDRIEEGAQDLDVLHDLLLRRFSDCSGVHLFIAASNLHLDLPPDLQDQPGEIDSDGDGSEDLPGLPL